ncbi:MAG: glycosyltransferase family 4 protein [Bacteroidota bacterium]
MPKRIIILTELYYPEESGTGYVMAKIAEGLVQNYSVTVLCGYSNSSHRTLQRPSLENRNGVVVERCAATRLNKDVMLFRMINLFTISASIFLKALRRIDRGDSILVVTNPPTLPLLALVVTRLKGAKCFLLIHDLYPHVLTATGILSKDNVISNFLHWLNSMAYQRVDKIVTLGRDMQRLVVPHLQADDHRCVIIRNWADLDEVLPLPREQNNLLKSSLLGQKFVVQYAGNMGRTHGLETLIEAAKLLSPQKKEIHFLFVGKGAKKSWLVESVKAEGLTNVTVLSPQPRGQLNDLLNACDVTIISFIPGMAGISVPSRMYNIMAAGKPIIAVADDDSELAMVVREERIGWVVPPNDPHQIVRVVLEAYTNPNNLLEMGKSARAAAVAKYSLPRVIDSYRLLFSNS